MKYTLQNSEKNQKDEKKYRIVAKAGFGVF